MMAKLIQLKMNKSEGIILQTDAAKAQEEWEKKKRRIR
jgi:hypothetical protein